jgi:hypothetical protein
MNDCMTCVAFRIRRIFAGVQPPLPPAHPTRIRADDVSALGNYSAGSSKRSRSPAGVKPYYGGELTQRDLREPRFLNASSRLNFRFSVSALSEARFQEELRTGRMVRRAFDKAARRASTPVVIRIFQGTVSWWTVQRGFGRDGSV